MTKFYSVTYTTTETVTTTATVEGDSAEAVVDSLRNQMQGVVDSLTIHEVVELQPTVETNGKPNLRLVN